jgi:hypothetical protein
MGRLAIMQPYFLPYIGYWQLLRAAERFVVYDDVNYIKGGWVNRNRVLVNGAAAYITVPLQRSSPYRRICDISLDPSLVWREKMVRTIETAYRRAGCFDQVFPVIEGVIRHEASDLSAYLVHQLHELAAFMGIRTEFVASSRCYGNGDLSGQERVIDICRREGANAYINAQGGQALYDADAFFGAGMDLRFIVMRSLPYKQRSPGFVPCLSIVDALMEVGPDGMKAHLDAFDLVGGQAAGRAGVTDD